MRRLTILIFTFVLVLGAGWAAAPTAAAAQASGLASQSLRPYAHVFVAYALAWVLVLGWVVSLARRWARVEDELGD